ncbi:apolipoprotein L6-like [Pristis pectinata]|uniref:apolipoprotein L6-like n=1 Tax=Pristis pectinata TaxID=685728 RepID=UPI00223C961C|nr:apolipoprotein L6-like [Pristis pectinata]
MGLDGHVYTVNRVELKTELGKHAKECQVFVRQFPDWKDQIDGNVKELREIADSIDEYHIISVIASISGASAAVLGGALSTSGMDASPFTLGTSLGLSAVGGGISTAGAVTTLTAGTSETITQFNRQKVVNKIIQQYNDQCQQMSMVLSEVDGAIKSWSLKLRGEIMSHEPSEEISNFLNQSCNTAKYSDAIDRGWPVGAAPSTAGHIKPTSQQVVNVKDLISGSFPLPATVLNVFSAILTVILVVSNTYSITKNFIDLSKGSKTTVAKNIQDVAMKMEDELKAYEDIAEFLKVTLKVD